MQREPGPQGFRREGSTVVVTPETALRLPDDPACVVLASASEESVDVVTHALTALGLLPG